MSHVLSFPPPRATFTFTVTHDDESGMWVAVCDDLCVATEAPTYEALVQRVWLIAPEMAGENGLNIPEANLRLLFQHESMHQAGITEKRLQPQPPEKQRPHRSGASMPREYEWLVQRCLRPSELPQGAM